MGICASASSAPTSASRSIDKALKQDHQQSNNLIKLLLLGAGESGKSTLFKQCRGLYGRGFTKADRLNFKASVHKNVVEAIQTLLKESKNYSSQPIKNQTAVDAVMNLELDLEGLEVDQECAKHIESLWAEPAVQAAYEQRSQFQLVDSASYYFERISQLGSPDYVPSQQDILRARVRTTGMIEEGFQVKATRILLLDVGGQRSERKKWIHCFEGVNGVIFVVGTSEYDQKLYEDNKTNRLKEALSLWRTIVNSEFFVDTTMILFLNKRDLFAEKIRKVPLNTCFEEYKGENEFQPAMNYLQTVFVSQSANKDRTIYIHVTCATDTNIIQGVMDSVMDSVIERRLIANGLV